MIGVRTTPLTRAIAVGLLICLLGGCQTSTDSADDGGKAGAGNRPQLLSAADVHATKSSTHTNADFDSLPCRVDLPSLVPELTGENKKIYERRTNAGVTRIVLGAWKEAD